MSGIEIAGCILGVLAVVEQSTRCTTAFRQLRQESHDWPCPPPSGDPREAGDSTLESEWNPPDWVFSERARQGDMSLLSESERQYLLQRFRELETTPEERRSTRWGRSRTATTRTCAHSRHDLGGDRKYDIGDEKRPLVSHSILETTYSEKTRFESPFVYRPFRAGRRATAIMLVGDIIATAIAVTSAIAMWRIPGHRNPDTPTESGELDRQTRMTGEESTVVEDPERWIGIAAIALYGASMGVRYYIHLEERRQDTALALACVVGVIVGSLNQLGPQEILFQTLPGLALAALMISSLISLRHRRMYLESA